MGRFSILRKKERWSLTLYGRLLFLVFFTLLCVLYVIQINQFLSPVKPVKSSMLVVEGFLPDYALAEAMTLYNQEGYKHLLITGKPRQKGAHLDQFKNDGEFSAAVLIDLGFDPNQLSVVAIDHSISKNRTYESAKAVKDWIRKNKAELRSIDLVSIGCHSRRSYYLFDIAFGDDYQIGIISIADRDFDPKRWWLNSHGFREVNKETIAWVYARFFFFPEKD